MTEVSPGVHQLHIPMPNNPLSHTNDYLLRGEDGYLLIDTGWNNDRAFQALEKELAELETGLEDISRVVVTHSHADHYGLTGRLKKHSDAEIIIHEIERDILAVRRDGNGDFMKKNEAWFARNGVPPESFPRGRMTPAERRRLSNDTLPDTTLKGGETIHAGAFDLEVIWTPGHSPGHICLYERERKILFAGDHVLPGITPHIGLQPGSGGDPLGDFLRSLAELRKLDVNTVLPAHEGVYYNLQERIDQIVRHHRVRSDEIAETLRSGTKNACEVSSEITWMPDFGGVRFTDLNPWVRRMAVSETLAHLKVLENEGIVEKFSKNGIIYYRLLT